MSRLVVWASPATGVVQRLAAGAPARRCTASVASTPRPVPAGCHAARPQLLPALVSEAAAPLALAPGSALPPEPGAVALCLLRGPDYVVELFNPMAARVWGRPAAQMLGRPFLETLPPPAAARYAAACASVEQSGQAVTWAALPVVLAADSGGALEISYFDLSFQLFRVGEQVAGILLVAQEVTPLLQARQQVRQLQAELAATTAGLADYVTELTQVATRTG